MMRISACRSCKNKNIKPFFDLGRQPLANSLIENLQEKEKKYPLSLSWCARCNLVQLNYTVDPKKLFSRYIWVTGTSKTTNEFSNKFCNDLLRRSVRSKDGYVLEIASNDGTFLLPFIRRGYRVLGIDSAKNIARIAEKNGIPTKCWFFGIKTAKRLLKECGFPKIIFARNVLPHVANTRDFVQGLKLCLSDSGIAAVEVHYAKKIFDELQYDSIYHEHLCYFTVKSLEKLLNDVGLFILDIEESPLNGGSIIVYIKNRKIKEKSIVRQYRSRELKNKVNNLANWKKFAHRAFYHRKCLLTMLKKVKSNRNSIIGYGASARSSTLLNFCNINSEMIQIIADKNSLKQNKWTAGSHIKIMDPIIAMKQKPIFIFILAWNFTKEIKQYLEDKFEYRGRYIVPLPKVPRIKSAGKI